MSEYIKSSGGEKLVSLFLSLHTHTHTHTRTHTLRTLTWVVVGVQPGFWAASGEQDHLGRLVTQGQAPQFQELALAGVCWALV